MNIIDRESVLWSYLPEEIQGLFVDGETILTFVQQYKETANISDYSFLVFPFSKAYEGFLKKFLLDMQMINKQDYFGDDIRIGRILNPTYIHEHNNAFKKLCDTSADGRNVSEKLWNVWKRGRNLVFHYFPRNFRRLSYDEALDIINEIVSAMILATSHCAVKIY